MDRLILHVSETVYAELSTVRANMIANQKVPKAENQVMDAVSACGNVRHKVQIARLKQHLEERILNLACPRCSQVFTDFSGV